MPFLLPNQQYKSTEGKFVFNIYKHKKIRQTFVTVAGSGRRLVALLLE